MKSPSHNHARSGALFLAASLVTGGLNYFFQVFASRFLSPQDFSELNGWFADLAIFFVVGGLLQYGANFRPATDRQVRVVVTFTNLLAPLALIFWLHRPGVFTLDRALIIIAFATVQGWLSGQTQARFAFGVLSIASLGTGLAKLGMVWLPLAQQNQPDRYAFALFAALLPTLWAISAHLWLTKAPPRQGHPHSWAAPLVLSIATVIIPQFDLVLMHHTQDSSTFADFAHASLFYKAIYFIIFILAQWLLPRQIQDRTFRFRGLPFLLGGMIALSLGAVLGAPLISRWMLHWPEVPPADMIFYSCLHMSLLTMLFLQIQQAAADHRLRMAGLTVAALCTEAALQLAVGLPCRVYLIAALVAQSTLVLLNLVRSRVTVTV